jgi:hypothetical protein
MPRTSHHVYYDDDAWEAAVKAGRKDIGDGIYPSAYLRAALKVRQHAPDWLVPAVAARAHEDHRFVEDVVIDALRAYLSPQDVGEQVEDDERGATSP